MPLHDFECGNGHRFEAYQPIDALREREVCPVCFDGSPPAFEAWLKQTSGSRGFGFKVFTKAPMTVTDIPGYQSPVDGRWVEGRKARREDLARNNCVPYEPSMKEEQAKRLERSNAAIDAKVDAHVESEIYKMPARKREKLEAELRTSDLEVARK